MENIIDPRWIGLYIYTHYTCTRTRTHSFNAMKTASTRRDGEWGWGDEKGISSSSIRTKFCFCFVVFSYFVLFEIQMKYVCMRHPRPRHQRQCNQRVRRVLRELHRIHMYLLLSHTHITFVFVREFFVLSRIRLSLSFVHSFLFISFLLPFKSGPRAHTQNSNIETMSFAGL